MHRPLLGSLLILPLCVASAPRAGAEAAPLPPSAAAGAPGKVFLTIEEALALAFPECEVEERTAYLSKEERAEAERLAGVEVPQALQRSWLARRAGALVGTAYVEAHRVRTLKESVMVVVDPGGKVARFELLAFGEPEEYVPRDAWYAQLVGHPLDDELRLGRGIRAVSGATLTARATVEATRRVLALHAVLSARDDPGRGP